MTLKLAIFDCDGTLVDSQADICAAMDAAFEAAGLTPPDRNATRRVVGLSLPEAMRRLRPTKPPTIIPCSPSSTAMPSRTPDGRPGRGAAL
jgi:phosphoglycolate phosphatase-like HAD superfamily hydrolase